MLCKSIDWFLYDSNFRQERVNSDDDDDDDDDDDGDDDDRDDDKFCFAMHTQPKNQRPYFELKTQKTRRVMITLQQQRRFQKLVKHLRLTFILSLFLQKSPR